MENIKQQIEELRKQLKESYKENRKQIWKLEEVLQQQVNKFTNSKTYTIF